ncbi:Crp/Fnr family transcriptional regulator [Chitinophaga rhizophila]|uniref:Crp/Fnr family transcriptional regulator n=1 Tax=Chitinophaga rhizophila TaxID=2866212 RepID=A0ABS7GKQ1_9BACT|nr:Crp/Fnr family transcriptional regulator [Chitinophaga rhizophila]MBW8688294.1 Crp/Fnr family transcriptional regulator [Chitinophaga rhizophila]
MEELFNFLLQFGQLNQQQMELIRDHVFEKTIKKEDYFSQAGRVPREIGFMRSGIMRVCYFNNKGEEITKYFMEERNMIVDIFNFEAKTASTEYVQAVTDCEMIIFTYDVLQMLSATIVDWDRILGKIRERALLSKVNRISPMVSEDATTRYTMFMEKYPGMVNRIPLSYLASYLGITQSSLSRIRKQLSGSNSRAGYP